MAARRSALAVFAVSLAGVCAPPATAAPTITEFTSGLTPNSGPSGITAGPDGNLWFTETSNPGRIGRITPQGAITEFTTGLTPNSAPYGIAAGPDGNVWFTGSANPARIGRITPQGAITEFTTGLTPDGLPNGITSGPDGNVWFAEERDRIGRITPQGTITEFSAGVSTNSQPSGITAGADGNLWFTELQNPGRIGRITPAGAVTEFTAGLSSNSVPNGITTGPDGNVWFVERADPGRIGRITPAATITEFTSGMTPNGDPYDIASGPEGNLWFTERADPGRIGRITPAGAITEFTAGLTPNSQPSDITAGPDGNVWFTEPRNPGRIGRITTPPAASTGAATVLGSGAATVTGTVNGHAQSTTYRFRFGPTTGYGSSTPSASAGSGYTNVAAPARLSGLQPATTYHYRLEATNPTDTASGVDAAFTTLALPGVRSLRVSPRTWRRGRRLTQFSRRTRRRRAPVGTRITFSLTRAAPVRVRFFAVKPGRRVRGKCRAPRRRNRRARRCKRLRPAGTLAFTGHAGKNTIRFQGRVSRRRKLRPGRYRVRVTATDPTTPKTTSRTTSFRIVKR